ncbi:NADH-quinone oxidoreductase subunit D 1 [Clarias magur]|uniref:NADH-quinone oxidoreductase subunit D 1 n=1 Tax=Clarias magur TaxID=1594786 RepID=A0A8J4UTU0_CLAMG|nr:NADH-quinone oxidoreductase subunit D 1 [Clarias magur]
MGSFSSSRGNRFIPNLHRRCDHMTLVGSVPRFLCARLGKPLHVKHTSRALSRAATLPEQSLSRCHDNL